MDLRSVHIGQNDWVYIGSTNLWATTFLDGKTLHAVVNDQLLGNLIGVIAIVFRKRDKWIYLYENCVYNEFRGLLNSESKGDYFNQVIKYKNFWKIMG